MKKFVYICGMILLCLNMMAQQREQLEHDTTKYCHGTLYKHLKVNLDTTRICFNSGWRYDFVLSDEFDSVAIDTMKWKIKHKKYFPTKENVGYIDLARNIRIQDSSLFLSVTTNDDSILCQPSWGTQDAVIPYLLSGWLSSKKTFRYGYIETECYLPKNHHYWPCFWTTARDTLLDDYDEVDVFERTTYNNTDYPYIIRQNCYNGSNTSHESFTTSILTFNNHDSITGKASVFGAEILPKEVVFYINGHVTGHLKYNDSLGNEWNSYTCTDIEEMIPMYFVLCLTCPKSQHTLPLPDESARFNYMRCFKLERGSRDTYHPSVFAPSDESTKVYPHIILGGNGCSAYISTPTALWAEQDIVLDKGFELAPCTAFSARVIAVPDPDHSPLYIQNCHNH